MSRSSGAAVLAGILAAICCGSGTANAEPAEVEALIAKGNELRLRGRPQEALVHFQNAHKIISTPRTIAQLGLAELAAGYPVEGAQHLAEALETPSHPSIAKYRPHLLEALARARSQIGEVAVDGEPKGAEVLVNGRPVGVLPLATPIKVAAGLIELEVRAAGYLPTRESIRVSGGAFRELRVSLAPTGLPSNAPPPGPAAVPPPRPPESSAASPPMPVALELRSEERVSSAPPDSRSGTRLAPFLFGGGALAATGTGLLLHLTARRSISDFNRSCARIDGKVASEPNGPLSQEDCEDAFSAWEVQRRWSIVGYISGAALTVTSAVLFWRATSSTKAESQRAHLHCSPAMVGLSCAAAF